MSELDPETVELVILRSPLRSNLAFTLDRYPARSLLLVLVMLAGAVSLDRPWVWLVVLGVGPALVICEVWHTRDYVTKTRVVRQRGILGRSRHEIMLHEVTAVRLRNPGFPELPGQRDLEVHGSVEVLEFLGVRDAAAVSERITALAEQARASTRST